MSDSKTIFKIPKIMKRKEFKYKMAEFEYIIKSTINTVNTDREKYLFDLIGMLNNFYENNKLNYFQSKKFFILYIDLVILYFRLRILKNKIKNQFQS